MGSTIRLIVGIPVSVLVTGALFLMMASLIKQPLKLDEATDAVNIKITQQIDDTDLNNANRDIKRPTLDAPPPPPPAVNDPSNRPALNGVAAQIPTINANLSIGSGFNPDRDAQPLVRIPPQYPERCMTRAKASESVMVQFDVTPDGQTTNITTVESSNSCLNRAAERSVERWKYQPKIVDNTPEWRRGVQTVVRFELSDG
ncbi:energy transducer TonB [Hyphococcus sp.]|uniref:energy transducer TonB n=1 Tax=Hyphococcus sp. TaxID=2038636 RepID=UPI00208ABF75|nr:MAG: protein TonB [Marinicaulis sp.]